MSQTSTLEKIKIILELEDDNSKDGLLEIYIQNAQDYILDYTLVDKIPVTLESVIMDMVVFQYRQRGVENTSTESKGALYESYLSRYPDNILNRLNSHRRVTVV